MSIVDHVRSTRPSAVDRVDGPILSIAELSIHFPDQYADTAVVQNVSLDVAAGECVAVVGESGCGKSLLGLSAAGLLPKGARVSGTVRFQGRDINVMRNHELRNFHGAGVGVVYQDAMTSLNPGLTIGRQLKQVCRLGSDTSPEELLHMVELRETARILHSKPYQLSGGQRQRVLIALALARRPDLVIADEPTTALDVTVQEQIIELLKSLQRKNRFALLFISHDLPLISSFAQSVVVMYAGQVVEKGETARVLGHARHPYTAGLLAASLSLENADARLSPIRGTVGQPGDFLNGCRFRDRCDFAGDDCVVRPLDSEIDGRDVWCHHPIGPRS